MQTWLELFKVLVLGMLWISTVFKGQDNLYKWLLSKLNLNQRNSWSGDLDAAVDAVAAVNDDDDNDFFDKTSLFDVWQTKKQHTKA